MSQEERYSGKRGLQGCLVAWVFLAIVPLTISYVLNQWLGVISNETERVILVVIWFLAVCLAGYVAARLGKTTGWTNALIVGLLAEIYVYSRLSKKARDEAAAGNDWTNLADPLIEAIREPAEHWRNLLGLTLTIPVAILGGLIWQATAGQPQVPVASQSSETN